ncbi:MAG TPA: PCYCGC motif-containing (lipo)protein [Acidimicrobiia bacterium]|nr:PCYCGC motif-containing (lipo)protein [Acidimicrobiia bacterium]
MTPPAEFPNAPSAEPQRFDGMIRRIFRIGWAVASIVAVALLAVALQATVRDRPAVESAPSTADENMMAVAPGGVLAPADVPPGLAAHYQAAQDHSDIFETVPCFCGCEEMLGHRHLGDCFVRADGQGLEAHALGCGVCLGEAQQVMDLLAAGIEDPNQIRDTVVAEWSDPYLSQ